MTPAAAAGQGKEFGPNGRGRRDSPPAGLALIDDGAT